MKAVVKRSELITHRKYLKMMKTPKKLAEIAQVTISTSQKFSVTGPGFSHDMDCKAETWGTVSMPYKTWQNLVNLTPILKEKEITIAAETFQMEFGKTKIENHEIQVSRLDKLALEIPVDAKPIEIVQFAMWQDRRTVRNSVVWKTVKKAVDQVRKQMERACIPLKKYGICPEDLAMLVAENIGIKDKDRFIEILFSNR